MDRSQNLAKNERLLARLSSNFSFHFTAASDMLTNRNGIADHIRDMILPDHLDESGSLDTIVLSPNGVSDTQERLFFRALYTAFHFSPSTSLADASKPHQQEQYLTPHTACSSVLTSHSLKMIWLGLTSCFEYQLRTVARFAHTIPKFQDLNFSDKVILLEMSTLEVLTLLRMYHILSDVEALVNYCPIKGEVCLLPLKLMQSLSEEFYEFHDR